MEFLKPSFNSWITYQLLKFQVARELLFNLGDTIPQLTDASFSGKRGHDRGMTTHSSIAQISERVQLLFEASTVGSGQVLKLILTWSLKRNPDMDAPKRGQFSAVAWIRSEKYAICLKYESKAVLFFDLGKYAQEVGSANRGLASTQPHLNKMSASDDSQEFLSGFHRRKEFTGRIRPF
jgi:hypothetical protein